MRTIYKYKLCLGLATVQLPQGAQVVDVRPQNPYAKPHEDRAPYLWALVDPGAPAEPRTFRVVGTGQPVDDNEVFISTFHMYDGLFVAHVFEVMADV